MKGVHAMNKTFTEISAVVNQYTEKRVTLSSKENCVNALISIMDINDSTLEVDMLWNRTTNKEVEDICRIAEELWLDDRTMDNTEMLLDMPSDILQECIDDMEDIIPY